jgi:hypothetical protein
VGSITGHKVDKPLVLVLRPGAATVSNHCEGMGEELRLVSDYGQTRRCLGRNDDAGKGEDFEGCHGLTLIRVRGKKRYAEWSACRVGR